MFSYVFFSCLLCLFLSSSLALVPGQTGFAPKIAGCSPFPRPTVTRLLAAVVNPDSTSDTFSCGVYLLKNNRMPPDPKPRSQKKGNEWNALRGVWRPGCL